jgi:DNA-binding CsgD family transcriptional regulator
VDGTVGERASALAERIGRAIADVRELPGFSTGDRVVALLALLDAERGRVEGRNDPRAWAIALGRWEGLGRPFQVAYARFREAEAILAARGDRDDVKRDLDAAAAIASELGAQPLADLVRTLARQARIALSEGTGGAEVAGGQHFLTSRESEVLRLICAGWTNQQIADALFITRKTASVHASNIMAKLGAANRGEAAALGLRLGLVTNVPLPVGQT